MTGYTDEQRQRMKADAQLRVDYDDPRIALYKPEEVAAAVAMVGNRKRRRIEAAKLRAKSRT